jgi:radical SAM superfamily enzyme with C-terminal helix-hairpin-helix motif
MKGLTMRLIPHTLRTAGVSALLALTLAACGSATGGTTAGTTPATGGQAAAATATITSADQATAPAADTTSAPEATPATDATTAPESTPATTASVTKLNLNTLTEDQLLSTIPNFSNRMVREFMEYRPYISIQQFRKEIGKYVDEVQVTAYEQYVYVPISVNESDAATIQQIAGVDASVADQLIAARPYTTNDDFLAKLVSLAPSADRAQAASYLATQ